MSIDSPYVTDSDLEQTIVSFSLLPMASYLLPLIDHIARDTEW